MDGYETKKYKRPTECPICDGVGTIQVYTSLAPGEREDNLSVGEKLYCILVANHLDTTFEESIRLFFDTFDTGTFPVESWDSFDAQLREILIEQQTVPKGVRVEGEED